MDLNNSVAIISGGASGLGEACARDLVKAGAKVCILDFAEENGERIASDLGNEVIFFKADVTDEKTVQASIDKTIKIFGGIHVLVNCAGVGISSKVLTKGVPISIENFNRVIQINLIGTFNLIRLVAANMLKNIPNSDGEKGVIVNTASTAAFEGQIGQAAYSASKAAIVGMTLPIAREFADYGIRVMTIAPGLFNTPMLASLPDKVKEALNNMVPFPSRLGQPSEFAQIVKQIVENPMLNGSVIRLDGALRMSPK
jgi:3-hydroxyacyl-CoA dehydrogenase / 3-hydroxy-2-methylbutyryl-CoA dehydrogenase